MSSLRCWAFAWINDCANGDVADFTYVQTQKTQSLYCLNIARGCFFLPLFANPRIVLNFIPDLYPIVLNCFCLLFFIIVVTSAISIKLIVFWKLYPSCPFTMFTLFCRSHFIWLLSHCWSTNLLKFWRSITHAHSLLQYATPLVTQELFIYVQLVAHAPDTHQGPNSSKIPVFLHLLTQPVCGFLTTA